MPGSLVPEFNPDNVRLPDIRIPTPRPLSETALESLVEQMRQFQARLTDDFELGIVANGAGLIVHVERVRVAGQMIVFDGVNSDGHAARLIQHFTQVNVQMVAAKKLDEQPRRIGF